MASAPRLSTKLLNQRADSAETERRGPEMRAPKPKRRARRSSGSTDLASEATLAKATTSGVLRVQAASSERAASIRLASRVSIYLTTSGIVWLRSAERFRDPTTVHNR